MTTEWGALAGVFPFDMVLKDWLTAQALWLASRGASRYTPEDVEQWYQHRLQADSDAWYAVELELDLAIRHSPRVRPGPREGHAFVAHDRSRARRGAEGLPAVLRQRTVRGSSSGRRRFVNDKHVADGVEFFVAAASETIQADAEADGTWATLERAGATFLPPGCGTCIGLGAGTLEAGETGISATNRNFKGRMGSRDAKAYLGSPAIVAASAQRATSAHRCRSSA